MRRFWYSRLLKHKTKPQNNTINGTKSGNARVSCGGVWRRGHQGCETPPPHSSGIQTTATPCSIHAASVHPPSPPSLPPSSLNPLTKTHSVIRDPQRGGVLCSQCSEQRDTHLPYWLFPCVSIQTGFSLTLGFNLQCDRSIYCRHQQIPSSQSADPRHPAVGCDRGPMCSTPC